MSKIIGIDLGTTNSCVSVMEGNDPVVIKWGFIFSFTHLEFINRNTILYYLSIFNISIQKVKIKYKSYSDRDRKSVV